jgi:curved DNA-binding protein CbpA
MATAVAMAGGGIGEPGGSIPNLVFIQGESKGGTYSRSEKISSKYLDTIIETELDSLEPIHNFSDVGQEFRKSFLEIMVSGEEKGIPLKGEIAERLRNDRELRKQIWASSQVQVSFKADSRTILQIKFMDPSGIMVSLRGPMEIPVAEEPGPPARPQPPVETKGPHVSEAVPVVPATSNAPREALRPPIQTRIEAVRALLVSKWTREPKAKHLADRLLNKVQRGIENGMDPEELGPVLDALEKSITSGERGNTAHDEAQIWEEAVAALENANARAEENAGVARQAEQNAELARQAMDLEAQVQDLQGKVELAQAEARELPVAKELIGYFATVTGMEQQLRILAEGQAKEYLQVIDSFKAEIAQLSQAIASLQKKSKEASLHAASAKRDRDEQRTRELADLTKKLAKKQDEMKELELKLLNAEAQIASMETLRKELANLKEKLAAKQREMKELELKLLNAEAQKAQMETLRGELASSKAAEQAAKKEASQQRTAAEAARTRVQDREQLLSEIDRIRQLLNKAQETETILKKAAIAQWEAAKRANAEAAKQRKAAERERKRADENEYLAMQASRLEEEMGELSQAVQQNASQRSHIRDVLNRYGNSDSSRPSHSVVSISPKVAEAFAILRLDPKASHEEFIANYHFLAKAYHPDRLKGTTMRDLNLAQKWFKKVVEAREVLEDFYKRQESAMADRESA